MLGAGVPNPSDDHWEDHLIARQLSAGEGFRTNFIYPPLWTRRDPETLTVPVLVHGPLLPMLTVPALEALGPRAIDSVSPIAALVALLALIPIFRIGERHFGEAVGAAAAGLFTFSPLTLLAVHHSGSVVLGAALVATILDLIARPRPLVLAGGLVAGAAYLVRPETLVAMPLFAILAGAGSLGARRWPAPPGPAGVTGLHAAAAFVAAFAIVALPWWIHQARAIGSPFFNLTSYTLIGFWGARPDVSVMQDFTLTPERWPAVMRAELPGMIPKWFAFLPRAVKHTLFTPGGGTGWLALVGLGAALAGFSRPRRGAGAPRSASEADPVPAQRFALCGLALALIPVASMTLTVPQPLYVMPFSALHALGAALGASVVARALPPWAHRPRTWIGMAVLLMLPSSLPALKGAVDESRVLAARIRTERAALVQVFGAATRGPGASASADSTLPGVRCAWCSRTRPTSSRG